MGEYVATKAAIRWRDDTISKPGLATQLTLGEQERSISSVAGPQYAFNLENVEEDINEVYLWAAVDPMEDGPWPLIRTAAALARRGRLFLNPIDALRSASRMDESGQRALFLCRAVCGEISCHGDAAVRDADSEVSLQAGVRHFKMLLGEGQ